MDTTHATTSSGVGGTITGDMKRALDFSASDFATLVTTTPYVDKSLMIKDVYNAPSRILITAPRRFGKSTNMDMVKRFFEIEVDAHGNPKTVHTTNNYKLFKDCNFKICDDTRFFNEHFGKHPVVHIDFKPLGCVDDSAEILDTFKVIVKHSLNQHSYILKNSLIEHVFTGIDGFNVNEFRKYVSDGITKDVDGLNLATSFKHLSTMLNRVFGKKVFVLIDSYDAFLDSIVIKNHTDRTKIMSFVESSVGQLLNNVNCIDRVFLTGVISVIGETFLSNENNIEFYHFLGGHSFTKYYGLEISEICKFRECDEKRGFQIPLSFIYNSQHVMRKPKIYMKNRMPAYKHVSRRKVKSYGSELRYISKFKKCFKIEPIRQKLEELLLGNELQLDAPQPLSMVDVLKVSEDYEDNKDEHLSVEVELILALLYHFGYFSVFSEIGRGVVCVGIPSEEIRYELAKAVFHENRELYSSPHVNDILSALDAFQSDTTDLDQNYITAVHTNVEQFIRNVSSLYVNNTFQFTHIIECLIMNLLTRAEFSGVRHLERWTKNKSKGVLLKNKHKVAICVTCDCNENVESVHQKVTNDCFEERMFDVFNDICGKVIIAIGYEGRIAYSYYFNTDDNLRDVRTLIYPP